MKRKSKANGPSLRDKLSANFMKAFESDFATNGVDVIAELREKYPDRYAAIATQLIAAAEPPGGNEYDQAKSMDDIGRIHLRQMGITDPTEQQIEAALAAHNMFISELEIIAAVSASMEVLEEERELRQ
jgi:hypothetical protein